MPTFNHPITIRLAPTNISPSTNWVVANATGNVVHGPDGIYPISITSQIPNILDNVKLYADPLNVDPTISSARAEETSGVDGGGYYITAATNPTLPISATVGSKNTIDVLGNFSPFYSLARSAGATAFNLIIHGENDKGIDAPVFEEFSTVVGSANPAGGFNAEFYKTSAFVTFKSKESTIPSLTSNTVSFRKNYHHGLIRLSRADMAGISQSNLINDFCYIYISGGLPQSIAAGLSANGNCTFNRYSGVGETSTATGGTPKNITCANKLLQYIGIDGAALKFKNLTGFALYDSAPTSAAAAGRIISADATFNSAPNPVDATPYTLPVAASPLFLRPDYPATLGSKNLLGIVRGPTDPKLFSNAQNPGDLNIQKNSYIRIRGSASNDGIYQVINIQDGVPNDTTEVSANLSIAPFQYLELSRDIVPEEAGASITIEDVTSLPVLHIKYLQTQ
jgi:hypothetical protein